MPELSLRMEALLDWVQADYAADIGCDHAYVICEAAARGQIQKGYACDIGEKPLERAKETIERMGLQNRIECRLQDGMVPVPKDLNQTIIAGMGGINMMHIIEDWMMDPNRQPTMRFLLSPHADAPKLRSWLQEKGFAVKREKRVHDEGRWYPILDVNYPGVMELDEAEMLYGKNPVQDAVWRDYIESEKNRWQNIRAQTPEASRGKMDHHLALLETLEQQLETEQAEAGV